MKGTHLIDIRGDRVYRFFNRTVNWFAKELPICERMAAEGVAPAVLYAGPSDDHGGEWPDTIVFPRLMPLTERFPGPYSKASDQEVRRRVAALLASKLARVHAAGWAHRDIHALNVVLDGDDPYVIDWEWSVPSDTNDPYDVYGPQVGLEPPPPHVKFGGIWWGCVVGTSLEKLLGPYDRSWL